MIDPKELRIGNLVWRSDSNPTEFIIEGIRKPINGNKSLWVVSGRNWSHRDKPTPEVNVNPMPIPLTENFMKQFGISVDRHNGRKILFEFAGNHHCIIDDDLVYIEQYSEGEDALEHIKYVHQLQNLYFSLTGKELINL